VPWLARHGRLVTMARDRDERGRPRNSRGRDALGRPLPRGVEGVTPIPDDLTLNPEETLALAQQLLDAGLPFQAHEVLEAAWKTAPPQERDLWQGLAQLAVGLTHALRGNISGAETLFGRGATRLVSYADKPPYSLAVPALIVWAQQMGDHLRRPDSDVPFPRLALR